MKEQNMVNRNTDIGNIGLILNSIFLKLSFKKLWY
jgi:hypothetical protein